MPDISLCQNHECPKKDKCHRYLAKPCEYQYYGLFEAEDCQKYWPEEGE